MKPNHREGSGVWLVAAVNAIVLDPNLTANEKLILLVIAKHCDARGICWLLKDTILREARVARRTLRRVIQRLENKGKLDREPLFDPRWGQGANLFRVRVPVAGGLSGGGRAIGTQGGRAIRTQDGRAIGTLQKDPHGRISDLSDRSPLSFRSITCPPSPPLRVQERVGGRVKDIPGSWILKTRRIFPECHTPATYLVKMLDAGFSEREGCSYLDAAARATDLPQAEHRALGAWCSPSRWEPWRQRRERRRTSDVQELAPATVAPPHRSVAKAKHFDVPNPWSQPVRRRS